MNMEEKDLRAVPVQTPEEAHEEFNRSFLPAVHRIGVFTMLTALVFSVLPTVYFVFIRGIPVSLPMFLSVVVAIASFAIGMWISEPAAFWPVLGSAGTYFAFLAGNASNMRLPVALAARASLEDGDDLEHPKTHIAMIIALFASVVVNLAILLTIVLAGDGLLAILPDSVIAAFGFVMPCLLANNIIMQSKSRDGVWKGFLVLLPYLATGVAVQLLVSHVFTFLSSYAILIAVGMAVLVAYFFYRRDVRRDEEAARAAEEA